MYLEHLFFFDSDSTVAEGLGRDISKITDFDSSNQNLPIYNMQSIHKYVLYRLANFTFYKKNLNSKLMKKKP